MTTDANKDTGVNKDYLALWSYKEKLEEKIYGDDSDAPVVGTSGGGSSLPSGLPGIVASGLGYRVQQKPQAMLNMNDPQALAELDMAIDRMIEQNGIAEKPLEELNRGLQERGAYNGTGVVELLAKSNAAPAVQHKEPAINPTLEKQNVVENAVQL